MVSAKSRPSTSDLFLVSICSQTARPSSLGQVERPGKKRKAPGGALECIHAGNSFSARGGVDEPRQPDIEEGEVAAPVRIVAWQRARDDEVADGGLGPLTLRWRLNNERRGAGEVHCLEQLPVARPEELHLAFDPEALASVLGCSGAAGQHGTVGDVRRLKVFG